VEHDVVQPPEPLPERDDRGVVGDVNGLSRDAGLAGVGDGEGLGVPAGGDDLGTRVPGRQCHGARDPTASTDDEHGAVLQ